MSASTDNLVVNLSQIYQIKNQIKEVISTDSDVFADYPSYIQAAIQGGGTVSGYAYVTSNGDYDIASYAMVNVEVPVPPGYIVPAGTFEITDNDTYDVSSYAYVDVSVEAPVGEGTVYFISSMSANTIPATRTTDIINIADWLQYETLEIVTIVDVNYNDPFTSEYTHNPYWEFSMLEDNNVVSTSSGSFIDDDQIYWGSVEINTGSAPDTIIGEYYEWVEDIDPETGDDNGGFEIIESWSASITETLNDEIPIDIKNDEQNSGNWILIQDCIVVEAVTPTELGTE